MMKLQHHAPDSRSAAIDHLYLFIDYKERAFQLQKNI